MFDSVMPASIVVAEFPTCDSIKSSMSSFGVLFPNKSHQHHSTFHNSKDFAT